MKKFWLLILTLLPQLSWAQESGSSASSGMNFAPPPTDISINLLADIFGRVDGVLHGTGSQIVGIMFHVFNVGILAFGLLVLGYTVFAGVLKTAHEGEALGRQWSSIWIPLRASAGIALLIPKASGYCIMQILIMWITVQGVGLADLTWKAALTYIASGGVIIQQTVPANKQGGQEILQSSGAILSSLVCMHAVENQLIQQQTDAAASGTTVSYGQVPSFFSTLQVVTDGETQSLSFPGESISTYSGFESLAGICGTVNWKKPPLPGYMVGKNPSATDELSGFFTGSEVGTGAASSSSTPTSTFQGPASLISQSKELGVMQMVLDLDPLAQKIVSNNYLPSDQQLPLGYVQGKDNNQQWVSGSTTQAGTLTTGTELSDATNDYLGIIYPARHAIQMDPTKLQFIPKAIKAGWIMAGAFYYNLASINNNPTNVASLGSGGDKFSLAPTPPDQATVSGDKSELVTSGFFNSGSSYLTSINNLVFCSTLGIVNSNLNPDTNSGCTTKKQTYIWSAENYNLNYGYQASTSTADALDFSKYGASGDLAKFLTATFTPVLGVAAAFVELTHSQATNANPVSSMALLGSSLLSAAINIIILSAGAATGLASALGAVFGFTFSSAVLAFVGIVAPIVLLLISVFFATGALLAYYLPMLPFIMFTFGAIGWMIAVIEAMTAGPIVAMGLAYPEGHEVFGKAETAIWMLLNVFIRPNMMIIGYIIGISLSYVGVWLTNYGFAYIYKIMSDGGQEFATGVAAAIFMPLAMAIIYAGICYAIIEKAFSLIYILPDKTLRWLQGVQQETLGAEASQAGQAVKGSFQSGMQPVAESAKGLGEGLSKMDQARAKQKTEGGQGSASPGSSSSGVESSAQGIPPPPVA